MFSSLLYIEGGCSRFIESKVQCNYIIRDFFFIFMCCILLSCMHNGIKLYKAHNTSCIGMLYTSVCIIMTTILSTNIYQVSGS